jgi:hypothetical protein
LLLAYIAVIACMIVVWAIQISYGKHVALTTTGIETTELMETQLDPHYYVATVCIHAMFGFDQVTGGILAIW